MSNPISQTFFEHLDELRKRILISLAAIFAGTCVGLFYSDKILRFLLLPIRSQMGQFYFFSPAEAFIVKLKVAFWAGLLATSPIVISQIWFFVSPALKSHERRMIVPAAAVTSFLFLLGVVFAYYTAMPFTLQFLIGLQTDFLKPMISVSEYLNFVTGLLLAFGVSFDLPIFVITLVLMGLLNFKMLNRYHRHVIVLIFIAAAVLTPGPDIASQLTLAIPMLLLFEVSLAAAYFIELLGKKKHA